MSEALAAALVVFDALTLDEYLKIRDILLKEQGRTDVFVSLPAP